MLPLIKGGKEQKARKGPMKVLVLSQHLTVQTFNPEKGLKRWMGGGERKIISAPRVGKVRRIRCGGEDHRKKKSK